jgi:glycosyltransferase involved in cell wall biosynthesis
MRFPDLIFVSMENWDEVWRRNQFLCSGLARRFPQSKILFVGLPRDVSNAARRRDLSELRGEVTRTVPDYPNITVTRPLKLTPNTLHKGRLLNERMFRRHVRGVARKLGMERPLLWLNPHDAVHMPGRMGERAVLYDITDDWALASRPEREKLLIENQDQRLCRRADLVVVCSQSLAQSRRAHCKQLLLLPNGVDVGHYQIAPCRKPSQSTSHPVFGYTGTLHDDRIDSDLIVQLAQAFPTGQIVLIGPNFLSSASQQKLSAQPNVECAGPVPYARIAQEMQRFDVCIVPHTESAFTETLNPIKLWEYLACGKPIVSTNVAGFRDYPQLVHLASGTAFIEACRQALQEDPALCQARRDEAAQHSWDSRLDQLLATLESLNIVS